MVTWLPMLWMTKITNLPPQHPEGLEAQGKVAQVLRLFSDDPRLGGGPLGSEEVGDLVFIIPLHAARRAMAAAPPLPRQRIYLFPGTRTGLAGHGGAPNHQKETSPRPVKNRQRKNKGKEYILGRPWAPSSPSSASPASSGGTLPEPTHPALVVRRNSRTASAASTSHRCLADGALGLSHLQASPTFFHSLLVCGE